MQMAIQPLVARRQPGWSLPGEFYSDEEVYHHDVARVWRSGWLFAGHSCEIPKAGDYFTLEVDTDSIIVARGDDGSVYGLHNVCRHRGSRICNEPAGHAARLVCPYHQWTYGLDGRLLACRGMPPDWPKDQFPLVPVGSHEIEGLIFISLASKPARFDMARDCLSPLLQPQRLCRAKLAHSEEYVVNANWKLVWENNRECYHCNANHPEYIKANFDHYNADDTPARVRDEMCAIVARSAQT